MTDEEKQKIAEKKKRQHEAWKRWYYGPKGAEYKLKKKPKSPEQA